MPVSQVKRHSISSPFKLGIVLSAMSLLLTGAGCQKEILSLPKTNEKTPKMITSVAAPYGLEPMDIMGYGVVVGLSGTGGNVPQGPARSAALAMLNQQKMEKPTEFLASRDAAVVIVSGKVAAGARPGDTCDVEIRCLDEDKQTSTLRGGFLLLSSLKDVADVSQLSEKGADGGSNYRSGFEWAIANGPIMIEVGQEAQARKGRIVGGARLKKERQLALVMRGDSERKAEQAMRVGTAIDERFRVQTSGNFAKIANPKDDKTVLLRVPDQYKTNVPRFLEVLSRIPYEAGNTERLYWQRKCGEDLLDPDKCFEAAVRLEAMGGEVKDELAKGCKHEHIKVRFAAAESLAYLGGGGPTIDTLGEVVLHSPELRPYALTALSVVADPGAATKLRELMTQESMETKYGAFVALRTGYPTDMGIRSLAAREAGCMIYDVAPASSAVVHIATSGKPEIVLFGKGHVLMSPFSITVGPELVISARDGENECTISAMDANGKTVKRRCSTALGDVLARCSESGASYADLVDMLRQASNGHNLNSKLVVDAMPRIVPWSQLARAEIPVH
ncbi:MAG: flagellar basal body P-ring protein FlgI [Gemmatales bacterium]